MNYLNLSLLLCVITNFCSDQLSILTAPIIFRFYDQPGTYHIIIEPAVNVNFEEKKKNYTPLSTTTLKLTQNDSTELIYPISLPANAEYLRIGIHKYEQAKCIAKYFRFFDATTLIKRAQGFTNKDSLYYCNITLGHQLKQLNKCSQNLHTKINPYNRYIDEVNNIIKE